MAYSNCMIRGEGLSCDRADGDHTYRRETSIAVSQEDFHHSCGRGTRSIFSDGKIEQPVSVEVTHRNRIRRSGSGPVINRGSLKRWRGLRLCARA